MKPKYVLILDFSLDCLNIIELTDEEIQESENYENFGTFLKNLEYKYGFDLKNCQWMAAETLTVYRYKNGKEVENAELV